MKRSATKQIIKKLLMSTVGGDAAKTLAEDIIYALECVGMRPPASPENIPNLIYKKELSSIFAWEPEDDQN